MTALLHDYLLERAQDSAEDVAVVLGERRLSYGELERASNRLARQLVDIGCRRGDRIGLLTDKSPEAIVAVMASLKAGCAYVPLDVGSPAQRLERIVRSGQPAALLVGGPHAELGNELVARVPGPLIGALDRPAAQRLQAPPAFTSEDAGAQSAEVLDRVGRPDDLAHILFTSGSTGTPKGVMITHANVCAFIDWAVPHFGIRRGERLSGHPPLHFDLSTFDVYGAMASGAELHLVPGNLVLARQLADLITDHALTQWFGVPSAMTYMARFGGLPEAGFPSLERVLWCGEVLPASVLIQWMKRVPQARYANLYGPTEATIASTFHPVHVVPHDGGAAIAIGRPCGGEDVFVLGDEGQQLSAGEVGEIHIAGAGSAGILARRGELAGVIHRRPPAGRRRRSHLPHRRPGACGRGRRAAFRRSPGHTDQEPRLPDRAGGDRDGDLRAQRRGGVRRRRRCHRGFRRRCYLLRARAG